MKVHYLAFGLISSLVLSACSKPTEQAQSQPNSSSDSLKQLVIGYQKSSLNSITLKSDPQLLQQHFPNTHIEWKEFPAGPQLLEALSVGSVDFGSVGNTPPIFAQSGNKNLTYIAYEKSHPKSLGLLVAKESPIQSLQDLKGKRIALQRGSNAHDLLDKILQKANLTWSEIEPIWLAPADARAAFDKKTVDAWLIWEPFQSVALQNGHARVLTDAAPFEQGYSFIIANPDFLKLHPQAARQFIAASNAAAQWVVDHHDQAVKLYSQAIGVSPNIADIVLQKRYQPSLLATLTPNVVAAQQSIADRFSAEKLIPQSIEVAKFVYTVQP